MLDNNLKIKREEKGYSKMKLAKLSKISRKTIEFIESGKVKSPKLQTIEALAEALNIPIEELIK